MAGRADNVPAVGVPAASPRPLRADARRNRERIMAAARACFASDGLEAQMDDVARRARVGVGTLYRHFPDKQALLSALAAERFGQLAELAAGALEIEEPWQAFRTFMWRSAELASTDRAHCQVLGATPEHESPELESLRARTAELVRRGKLAGSIRTDFQPDDVPVIMCALGRVMERAHGAEPVPWQRYLSLVLDGVRADARTPLPR